VGVSQSINITSVQHHLLRDLLNKFLPNVQVWAFGSRVKGHSRPDSDLDIVVFSTPEQSAATYALKEALDESSLPFSVDVLVWNDISESFRNNISAMYFVLNGSNCTQ